MIIKGDCRVELQKIKSNSIDLVVTDPPYNVGKSQHGWIDNGWNIETICNELYRILKDDTRFYCFCGNKQISHERIIPKIEETGFKLHQTLIWHKRNLPGGTNQHGWDWKSSYENILLFHKGKPKKLNILTEGNGFDVRIEASPQSNFKDKRIHITQKPIQLIKDIIERSSNPGDTVLDCFGGSGTTAAACVELGRKYVIIEKDSKYIAKIKTRLKESYGGLFGEEFYESEDVLHTGRVSNVLFFENFKTQKERGEKSGLAP